MLRIHSQLFNELKRTSAHIAMGWLMTREDGVQFGFTSSDKGFHLAGVYYTPTNSFSGSAAVSKNNLSVDNMSAIGLVTDLIKESDLRGGKYDNAKVEVFWVAPDHPEWGTVPIRGGRIGELKLKNGQYETELRSVAQHLQQPFGRVYTLECDAIFGDRRCKAKVEAPPWEPGMAAAAHMSGDASVGTIVRPNAYSGFWYRCVAGGSQITTATPVNSMDPALRTLMESDFPHLFANQGTPLGQGGTSNDAPLAIKWGFTGDEEPVWPLTVGDQVADGAVTWEAILAREMISTVTAVHTRAEFVARHLTQAPDNFFQYGLLEWLTGENAGFRMEVRGHKGSPRPYLQLLEAMPYKIDVGDSFKVRAGCANTRAACKTWDNIYNMQGFPDIPTEDKALSTPNYSSQGEKSNDSGGGGGS